MKHAQKQSKTRRNHINPFNGFRFGSGFAFGLQNGLRSGSGLVQVWFRSGSGLVQVWFRFGSGLVQVWVQVDFMLASISGFSG